MLNWYANTFRISEQNITKSSLLRTKIFAWLLVLSVPLEIISGEWLDNPDYTFAAWVIGLLFIASLIGLLGLLASPLVHRFWARDKYLDEWEIEIKRKGMAAGYKVLFASVLIGVFISGLMKDYSADATEMALNESLGWFGFTLLTLAFGVQVLTQLHHINPIDKADMEQGVDPARPIMARVLVVFAILMIFIGPPMIQGIIDGASDALSDDVKIGFEGE